MKIYFMLIFIALAIFEIKIIHPHLVFTKIGNSKFPNRIVFFIEKELQKTCQFDNHFDLHLNEGIELNSDSFRYSLTFIGGPNMAMGEILIDEYHDGNIRLSYLKCPSSVGRSIGSISGL